MHSHAHVHVHSLTYACLVHICAQAGARHRQGADVERLRGGCRDSGRAGAWTRWCCKQWSSPLRQACAGAAGRVACGGGGGAQRQRRAEHPPQGDGAQWGGGRTGEVRMHVHVRVCACMCVCMQVFTHVRLQCVLARGAGMLLSNVCVRVRLRSAHVLCIHVWGWCGLVCKRAHWPQALLSRPLVARPLVARPWWPGLRWLGLGEQVRAFACHGLGT